jgi:hypothetical protein
MKVRPITCDIKITTGKGKFLLINVMQTYEGLEV